MKEQQLRVATPDGEMTTFLAMPDSGGPFPPIILFMDIWGMREQLHEVARFVAAEGFACAAPSPERATASSPSRVSRRTCALLSRPVRSKAFATLWIYSPWVMLQPLAPLRDLVRFAFAGDRWSARRQNSIEAVFATRCFVEAGQHAMFGRGACRSAR